MSAFTIDHLDIPTTLDGPGGDDFRAATYVRNAVEEEGYGSDELSYTAEELLPSWQPNPHEIRTLVVARVDGRIVARGVYEARPDAGMEHSWIQCQVLPDFRGRGIGTALSEELERLARAGGAIRAAVYVVSPPGDGPRLDSPTGFGSLPADNAEVRFLRARGYSLEQIERGSRLALPVADDVMERMFADAQEKAGPDYRVLFWNEHTPEQWLDDHALMLTRMSTDAPSADLGEPEDPWTADRLLDEERRHDASPRRRLIAAAEHIPSGRLAGFTFLEIPAEVARPIGQEDTLVLREHRGHRLGMLLKIANLREVQKQFPGHPSIVTFNAEENRPMLDVNEAIGFEPMGYEGAWKKVL